MKRAKLLAIPIILILSFHSTAFTTEASSIDAIINEEQTLQYETAPETSEITPKTSEQTINQIDSLMNATNYDADVKVDSINKAISKITSFLVKVIAYFITAFLAVRILLDLCYVTIPFTRKTLDGSNVQGMQGNMQGMQGNMQGMPEMNTGYQGGKYNKNMGGMQGGMPGQQQQAGGGRQWVSYAAITASMAEQQGISALKLYAKYMTVTLIVTPILLVLTITGAFSKLGFMVGEVIAKAIGQVGGMM